jgi:hypothetical protein
MTHSIQKLRAARRRVRVLGTVTIGALASIACDGDALTSVELPDVATADAIAGKAGLPTLLAGAVGEFQVAFGGSGGGEGQAVLSALFTDELTNVSTFSQHREIDARAIPLDNSIMSPAFLALHRARVRAEQTAASYAELDPASLGRAQALSLTGFSYVLFGENYCSGVPYSTVGPDGAFAFGAPVATDSTFRLAIGWFDAAATAAAAVGGAAGAEQLQLAKVGKARALLGLGRYAEAKQAVDGVAATFAYRVEHSGNSNRQFNGVYMYTQSARRFSVSDREGTNGIAWRSDADPRTPSARGAGASQDNTAVWYAEAKYTDRGDDIVLASGVEAELVRAEAELNAGDANWVARLDALRATVNLPALSAPADREAQAKLLFRERAEWLWLTGHRLGDLRRLVRVYRLDAAQVYPVGIADNRTGPYGSDLSFPLPSDEQNNPAFATCDTARP